MASASDVLKQIKDEGIEWVDLRFTDPKGKWQHLTMVASVLGEDELEDGLMFDGSSIAGWKVINESDMILKPDLERVYVDPFSAEPMLIVFCDIVEPSTGEWYARDPRSTAKRAEAYLKSTGVGDTIYVGPEAEFFMFDDVRFEDGYAGSGYRIDDIELPTNTGREYEAGNMAHRPRAKGGYFPVAPVDSAVDIRGEMVSTMLEMGLPCDKHHHEVAAAQHELGLTFGTLFALLGAYRSGLIRATENFKLGVCAATGGIMMIYLATFILGMFGVHIPFIHGSGLFGIGFSAFVVVIAALNLVLDFDFIENASDHGAPGSIQRSSAGAGRGLPAGQRFRIITSMMHE